MVPAVRAFLPSPFVAARGEPDIEDGDEEMEERFFFLWTAVISVLEKAD